MLGSNLMRRKLTVLITFLAGLYFFLEFILPESIPTGAKEGEGFRFGKYDEYITIGFTAVGTMAFALGAVSILQAHGGNVLRQRKRWGISAALILSMIASAWIGFAMWAARAHTSEISNPLEQLSASQALILSSAKTPPIPCHMRDWPEERVPEELRRIATSDERVAAQEKLVAALRMQKEKLEAQAKPPYEQKDRHPSDLLVDALAAAETTAASGLVKLKANDEDGAEADLNQAAAQLRAAGAAQRKVAQLLLDDSLSNRVYDFMFEGFYIALGSAMFSLLAFYIATAAYRAFRLQSAEAFLLMFAALLVMLGQIPVGVWLVDNIFQLCAVDMSITQVRLWILRVVNTSAFRGIALGSAIAGLSMAWRVWWSMESSALLDIGETGEEEGKAAGGGE